MNLAQKPTFHRWQPAAVLRVTGEDALSFLQGQFTNDLHQGGEGGAVYGLWLNQRGKVLADSFVRRVSPAEAWVVSYFSPAAVIRERLEAYVIADDVVIEDVTAAYAAVTLFGEVHPAGLPLGSEAWTFCGRRERAGCTEVVFPRAAGAAWAEKFAAGAELCAEEMERRRISAAIPAVPADIGAGDLPNEGGLESVAISYAKGCYLGQEVMARLKSMGQVRRRLLRVHGAGEIPARPGELFQGGQRVGELRSAVREGDGWIGLALFSLLQLRRDEGVSLVAHGIATVRITEPA